MQVVKGWLFMVSGAAICFYAATLLSQVDWQVMAFLDRHERAQNALPLFYLGAGVGLMWVGWIMRKPVDPEVKRFVDSLGD